MTLSPAGETTIALVMVGGIMAINLGGKLTISLLVCCCRYLSVRFLARFCIFSERLSVPYYLQASSG
jgi:hypothetical protein